MNQKNDLTPMDPVELDLLVDGELDEARRRELLLRLDREPENWRQCALAFLEAQAWRREMSRDDPPDGPVPALPRRMSRRLPPAAWTMAAMAACFLLALGIGLMMSDGRSNLPGSMEVVDRSPATEDLEPPLRAVGDPIPESPPAAPWRVVSVPVQSTQGAGSIGVPCTERQAVDESWLDSLPQAVPQDVVDALSRTGHRVTSERRPVSMPLEDGRELVIPVDQVEIRYVGDRDYQ